MTERKDCEPLTRTIHVYLDDPVWDKTPRWFNVPIADLKRLHVVSFLITGKDVDDAAVQMHAADIAKKYPGHILVY
jgi:hypothetical protein